jgi:predicted aspartyl protease
MRTTSWPSAKDSELIEVEFITLNGDVRSLKLLVDTGFTGKSSFVLAEDAFDLVRADYHPVQAVGAIQDSRIADGSCVASPQSHSVEC